MTSYLWQGNMGILAERLFLDKAGQVLPGIVREGNMEQRNDDMLKTACDIADMRKTAERINGILFAEFFDMQSARDVICEVNLKHPENVRLYNLITFGSIPSQPRSSGVSIDSASADNLRQDLIWKRYYLFAKAAGKGAKAIEKEWRKGCG